MLAETTYRAGKRYRDDRHHPLTFDVLAAGNVGRPSFDRDWFSNFEEWIQGCKELAQSKVVRQLLEVAAVREYEEDSIAINSKSRRKSSCKKEYHEFKQRTRSLSESSFTTETKEGSLDRCIKRTANMDLSTIEKANENSEWLSKEIRGVRKKLKQIDNLLDTEKQELILSSEQKAKIARRPTLETELSIYESGVEEVTKRIKELNIENQALQKQSSPAKVPKEIEASSKKKEDDPSDVTTDESDDKPFFCDVCGVKCSDTSNFILHQNGRKHRNKVAQLAEVEKEKTAATIRQKQQIELMNSAPTFTHPSKKVEKNAWGTPSSQPNYKLPPPPHPVLAQVSLSPSPRSQKGVMLASPKSILSPSSSNFKTPGKEIGKAKKKKPLPSPIPIKNLSPAASSFTAILCEQESAKKTLKGGIKESLTSVTWNSSPNSTRCVPKSLYSNPGLPFTPGMQKKRQERSPSMSLADFLTPKPKAAPSNAAAPWMKGPTRKPELPQTPNAKSIAQIQAEEETLRSKQDKSYGNGGGSWYVERRERAESVVEIQKFAQEDLEHRRLVEEQLQIEAQIRAENDRRQKLETEKSNNSRGAPKRKKKPQSGGKKSNQSNRANTATKAPETGKSNRGNGTKKPSKKNNAKKTAMKSSRQPQKTA